MAKKSGSTLFWWRRSFEPGQIARHHGRRAKVRTRVAAKSSELHSAMPRFMRSPPAVCRSRWNKAQRVDAISKRENNVAPDIRPHRSFTNCLFATWATRVYAVDVGRQLAWKIRNDPRVIVFEKLNGGLSREKFRAGGDLRDRRLLCLTDFDLAQCASR